MRLILVLLIGLPLVALICVGGVLLIEQMPDIIRKYYEIKRTIRAERAHDLRERTTPPA